MSTAAELINLALLDAGVAAKGQVPSAEDSNNALFRLNMMLDEWSAERWLMFHLVDVFHRMDGSPSYLIGPGQVFDTPRPDAIESAFIRQLQPSTNVPVDYQIRVIRSMEDYSRITLKTLQASPSAAVFHDSGFPIGTLYPYPIPDNRFELHVQVKAQLTNIASIQDQVVLPGPYRRCIWSNMVVMLCGAYKLPVNPVIAGIAKSSLETVRTANAQVPTMVLPSAVRSGLSAGGYNIFSDSYGA